MEYIRSNPEVNRLCLVSPVVHSCEVRVLMIATRSFPRLHLVLPTFTNSGLYTEISKEYAIALYAVFASLMGVVGKHPR
jgi:hypothetical protein